MGGKSTYVPPSYELIPEFDAAILRTLPKQGATLGFHKLGKQVKGISKQLTEEAGTKITSASIAGRVGVLKHHEYIVDVVVQPVSIGKGYQITPKGEQWLASLNEKEA